jgi:acetyl-CoA acetyltransferase
MIFVDTSSKAGLEHGRERMTSEVRVAGVGMIPFTKPGQSETYDVMGEKAARAAFADAGLPYSAVQQVYVGYVYGDSTAGQAAVYGLGLTGVPIINVNNNCSTGSSALFLARQAVAAGVVDCALALGFEEMRPGALGSTFTDRPNPMLRQTRVMMSIQEADPKAPFAAQYFGGAGKEYADKHGTRRETFAKIASKARTHAAHNPYAIFKDPLNVEEVLGSPQIYGPLTRFQCSAHLRRGGGDRLHARVRRATRRRRRGCDQGPGHDHRSSQHLRRPLDDQADRL